MSQLPPSPDRQDLAVPTPTLLPRRPLLVTVCGVVLVIVGVLTAVFGLTLVNAGTGAQVAGFEVGENWTMVGVAGVIFGALAVLSGVLIFRLAEGGRIMGIAVAASGVAASALQLSSGRGLVGLLLNVLVIYGLATNAGAFRHRVRR